MHKFLTILLTLLVIGGCESSKPGKDLIPPETLVPVLIDIHLVYALQSSAMIRDLAREVDSIDTYSYIFDKYDVTRVQFDSTVAWYSRHPKLFTDIYDQVVMQLSRMNDSLNLYQE
jgi:hypothetical protein